MGGREMADRKKGEEAAVGVGLFPSPKIGFDLVQNCDLPPPMRVFAGKVAGGERDEGFGVRLVSSKDSSEDEKLELLKALRLSQTRAREAEQKTAVLSQEKKHLTKFLVRQSMELFAYKQWVKMMEIQVSDEKKAEDGDEDDGEETCWLECEWLVAVAICFSIAGVGIFSLISCHEINTLAS